MKLGTYIRSKNDIVPDEFALFKSEILTCKPYLIFAFQNSDYVQ